MSKNKNVNLEKIINLCKRRGFIFSGSDIYGGLESIYDFGPLGVLLKNNIKKLWWSEMIEKRDDIVGCDSAIFLNSKVWEASGHISGFHDLMVECLKCQKRFRLDKLQDKEKCPDCFGNFSQPKKFNLMFKTFFGPAEGSENTVYLRPETAQGIFVNFAFIQETMRMKLPFGIAQIGKAFRNEITTGSFIFRVREFEQMEMEYFIQPPNIPNSKFLSPDYWFEYWVQQRYRWYIEALGIKKENLNLKPYKKEELAHYASATTDIEYNFPFGFSEIEGIAARTDFDLKQHEKYSGKNLKYFDSDLKKSFIPYVIEPSSGVERIALAILCDAYKEEEVKGENGMIENRIVLKFKPALAPIKIAVLPLVKNKPEIVKKAKEIFKAIKIKYGLVMYDEVGSIGKRYRRQDEIGTPYAITIDFDSLKDGSFTIRNRDTMKQERITLKELFSIIDI